MFRATIRILIGFNTPPLLGWVMLMLFFSLLNFLDDGIFDLAGTFNDSGFILFLAYYHVGVQALLYSLIVEFILPRYTSKIWLYLIFGVIWGYISGASVDLLLGDDLQLLSLMCVIGAITGLAITPILYYMQGMPYKSLKDDE